VPNARIRLKPQDQRLNLRHGSAIVKTMERQVTRIHADREIIMNEYRLAGENCRHHRQIAEFIAPPTEVRNPGTNPPQGLQGRRGLFFYLRHACWKQIVFARYSKPEYLRICLVSALHTHLPTKHLLAML